VNATFLRLTLSFCRVPCSSRWLFFPREPYHHELLAMVYRSMTSRHQMLYPKDRCIIVVSPVAHAENVFTVSFSCRQPLAWLRNGKSCRFEDYSQIPVHRLCPVPIQVACTCSLLQCLCLYYSSLQRYLRLRPSLGIPFPSPTSACPSPRMPKLGLSDAAPPHPARRINIISSHRSSYQILRIYKQTG
jgi:hypothetical protein